MKRIVSFVMALIMLYALALPTQAAAESAVGTTIRLAELEGKITVNNASGKTIDARADMKVYNGYTVETGTGSSVYITLDDEKAIQLGSRSKVQLKKSGKKLEVSLVTGDLYYGVDAPLKKNESLEIKTSNMVTGVRGSYGCVTEETSVMLHGFAEVTCITQSGEKIPTTLGNNECIRYSASGQSGVTGYADTQGVEPSYTMTDAGGAGTQLAGKAVLGFLYSVIGKIVPGITGDGKEYAPGDGNSDALNRNGFSKSPATVNDCNLASLRNLEKNERLQQVLQRDGAPAGLDLNDIGKAVSDKQQEQQKQDQMLTNQSQKEQQEQNNAIQKQEEEDKKNGVDNNVDFSKLPKDDAAEGGNSGQAQNVGKQDENKKDDKRDVEPEEENVNPYKPNPPTPTPTPTPTGPTTTAELEKLLESGSATLNPNKNITFSGLTVRSGQKLIIEGSKTVTLDKLDLEAGGEVVVSTNATLKLTGEDRVLRGTLTNNGKVESSCEMAMLGSIVNNGSFTNTGVIAISAAASFTGGMVINSGTIIVNGTFAPNTLEDNGGGVTIRN